jgi:hypothetical protein
MRIALACILLLVLVGCEKTIHEARSSQNPRVQPDELASRK